MQIRKAQRRRAKLRCGLIGPSGSGKTYSAIQMAMGLGKKILLVDTENGSGDLYAELGDYDIITLEAPFDPDRYINAIKEGEKENYDVIILDSISHAWAGKGGLLEQQSVLASRANENSYSAWRHITPKHNELIDAMLGSTAHIIATMRSKQEYVITKNGDKTEIKKVGLSPIQRDGMEYEFTVVFDIDINHLAKSTKDRTGIFGEKIFKIHEDTGKTLSDWLQGDPSIKYATSAQIRRCRDLGIKLFRDDWNEHENKLLETYKVANLKDIDKKQMDDIISRLEKKEIQQGVIK